MAVAKAAAVATAPTAEDAGAMALPPPALAGAAPVDCAGDGACVLPAIAQLAAKSASTAPDASASEPALSKDYTVEVVPIGGGSVCEGAAVKTDGRTVRRSPA